MTTPSPPTELRGPRIRLRRARPEDDVLVFRAASDPEVMRYMDWKAHVDPSETARFFAEVAQRWDRDEEYYWIIEENGTGRYVGSLACAIEDGTAELGYFLARDAWGNGYASEAVSLALNWFVRSPGIRSVKATADVENLASIKVLERVGFTRCATLPAARIRPNIADTPRDMAVFEFCAPAN